MEIDKHDLVWLIMTILIGVVAIIFLIRAENEVQDVYATCNNFWLAQVELACPAPQRNPGFVGWEPFNFSTEGDDT